MGTDRKYRINLHKKQERLLVKIGVPTISELEEGVPVLRKTSEGVVQYVSYNKVLYKTIMSRTDE
tara:strand:- start:141 stop:335 length:195 start_codon:yes stop_codon:yes gene_type:complete